MARVLDVRGSGGELVVLGGALTLPTSTNVVSSVLAGSLRYDPPSASVQLFNGSYWAPASGSAGPVSAFNSRSGAVTLLASDVSSALGFVPLASLSGNGDITVTSGSGSTPGSIALANTTVTAGTYGTFGTIPIFTVDARGRLTMAGANNLAELSAAYYGASPTASNNTPALVNWLSAVMAPSNLDGSTNARPGYLPPGVYKCTQPLIIDLALVSSIGCHLYGAGGQQSVIDLTGVSTSPALLITCSSGTAYNARIEGIAIKTNVAGVGVAIGQLSLADTINVLRFEEMFITNLSTATSAVALQMNSCNDCRVSVSVFGGGYGDALQLRATAHSVFEGKYSTASIGIHVTNGTNLGNVFVAPSTNKVNTSVVIDSSQSANNTFIGGQYVWNNGTGPSIAAINGVAGTSNRFIGANFASPGTIVTGLTGVIVTGYGVGQELLGGLSISPTTGNAALSLNSPAGTTSFMQMETAGLMRWALGRSATPEAGNNIGSDYQLVRYSDAGTQIDIPLAVSRSSGITVINSLQTKSVGFFSVTAPVTTAPTISGSRFSGAALASLLTALASLGLVKDMTVA